MSDTAREARECGSEVQIFDDQPPAIVVTNALLADKKSLATLQLPDPTGEGRMLDRVRAAALLKERATVLSKIEWNKAACAGLKLAPLLS